jgi:hypothetical protein
MAGFSQFYGWVYGYMTFGSQFSKPPTPKPNWGSKKSKNSPPPPNRGSMKSKNLLCIQPTLGKQVRFFERKLDFSESENWNQKIEVLLMKIRSTWN